MLVCVTKYSLINKTMPCNCGHLSCLCGVPCLCDASKCKCQDCDTAIGRVCNICNKAFYYEYLTLKETSEEEVCDCFLVKSKLRGANSTIETNTKMFYTVTNAEQGNMHTHLYQNQTIRQYEPSQAPHIPETLNGQSNDPSSTNHFKSIVLLKPERYLATVPKLLNNTSSNPSTEHSESTTQEQSEQNRVICVPESLNVVNNDPSSTEKSGIIVKPSRQSLPAHFVGSMNTHTNGRSNLVTYGLQDHPGESYAFTVPCELRQQPMSMARNYYIGHNESFYTRPENRYPEFSPIAPTDSLHFESGKSNLELKGITLKWFESFPNMELTKNFNDLLITTKIE